MAQNMLETPVQLRQTGADVALPSDVNSFLRSPRSAGHERVKIAPKNELAAQNALFGGFLPLQGHTGFSTVAYTVEMPGNVLKLSPMAILDEYKMQCAPISFHFAGNVAFNCVTLNEYNEQLILDVLLDSGLLVTLVLESTVFVNADSLFSTNAAEWCRYSMPTVTSSRKALFVKSLDACHSVVSLTDGGLAMFHRMTPTESFTESLFSSNSFIDSWSWNPFSRSKAAGQEAEFDGVTINTKAVIDVLPLTQEIFITLSVDKILTFWSKSNQQIIQHYQMNEYLPKDLYSAILSPFLPQSSLRYNSNILSIFLPIGNNPLVYLIDIDQNLEITKLQELSPPIPNDSWLPLDYCVTSTKQGKLEYWFTWYFGQSTIYQQCIVNSQYECQWNQCVNKSQLDDLELKNMINYVNVSDDVYSEVVRFLKLKYSYDVINQSIELFIQDDDENFTNFMTQDDQLQVILTSSGDFDNNDQLANKRQIVKFITVCQEIAIKSCENLLAVYVSNEKSDGFGYILKSNGTSILRKTTPLETVTFNSESLYPSIKLDDFKIDSVELQKLIKIITDYQSRFPIELKYKIERYIQTNINESTESLMNDLFQNLVSDLLNQETIDQLLDSLSKLKNGSELLQYLSKMMIDIDDFKLIERVAYTDLGYEFIKESIHYQFLTAEKIFYGFQLVLLTLVISDEVVGLFSTIKDQMINIKFFNLAYRLTDGDFIKKYITFKYDGGVLVNSSNVDQILTKFINDFNDDHFKYFVVSDLLAKGDTDSVKEFIPILPTNTIGQVLHGYALLKQGKFEESKQLFIESISVISEGAFKLTQQDKNVLAPIWEQVNILFVSSPVDLYFNIGCVFEELKCDQIALYFIMQSLDNKSAASATKETTGEILLNDILLKIFEISLRLREYDNAFSAINQMTKEDRLSPLKKFIYDLFQQGQLRQLLDFDFNQEDYVHVDDLIWEMGEKSIFNGEILLSLKYYRICYALRLNRGDLRYAAEVLHRFNTVAIAKYGVDIEPQSIMENSLIISNLMETMDNTDDRWIIQKGINGERNILVTYAELRQQWDAMKVQMKGISME